MNIDRGVRGFWSQCGFWAKMAISLGISLVTMLILFTTFRVMFVNFVDNYELGYLFDTRGGTIEVLTNTIRDSTGKNIKAPRTGYILSLPIVQLVHTVDLRPMQVCINANSRVLNCKLVKFNPEGIDLFLSWHGRQNYDALALNPILMSYAYDGSGKTYPFLQVLRELKPEEVVQK
jgi:hypothetical protein